MSPQTKKNVWKIFFSKEFLHGLFPYNNLYITKRSQILNVINTTDYANMLNNYSAIESDINIMGISTGKPNRSAMCFYFLKKSFDTKETLHFATDVAIFEGQPHYHLTNKFNCYILLLLLYTLYNLENHHLQIFPHLYLQKYNGTIERNAITIREQVDNEKKPNIIYIVNNDFKLHSKVERTLFDGVKKKETLLKELHHFVKKMFENSNNSYEYSIIMEDEYIMITRDQGVSFE